MNVRISLIIFALLKLYCNEAQAHEFYSQTVYLHKFDNPITQNRLLLVKPWQKVEIFGGGWLDYDQKTDSDEAYTDAQFSPMAGARSLVLGPNWLLSRAFAEARYVYRIKSFPDERPKETYDFRVGLMGYGFQDFSPLFLEHYYALFYTRLYGERVIFQGWTKEGFRFFKNWDVFNEFFVDTFDLTRDNDPTFDLRPGARYTYFFHGGSAQLVHQFLYHFTNLEFSGRSEQRTALIFGFYW